MDWIIDFEKLFLIKPTSDDKFKIIVGQQRYLQKLGETDFVIEQNDLLNSIYDAFPEVAFLVNDWIKVQDSLEMIFNLLTGSSSRSLEMLSYLRSRKVSVIEFTNYLLEERNVLLVNRNKLIPKLSNPNKYDKERLDSEIRAVVESINSDKRLPVHVLFVGKNQFKIKSSVTGITNKVGRIIHSSGVNLNKRSDEYYSIWYKQEDRYVWKYADIDSINLLDFQIL